MVLYFTPIGAETTKHSLYMGRDKVENEDLSACAQRVPVSSLPV